MLALCVSSLAGWECVTILLAWLHGAPLSLQMVPLCKGTSLTVVALNSCLQAKQVDSCADVMSAAK
jgi:hypothetical protein